MKKIVFAAICVAGFTTVKAQQVPALGDKDALYKKYFIEHDIAGWPKSETVTPLAASKHQVVRVDAMPRNVDRMPVVKMQGNSNMPVVQTDATAYTRPVAGMDQPKIYTMKKSDITLAAPVK